MLEVREGDWIVHLIDKGTITGYSIVIGPRDDSFTGLPNTSWAGKPCYRHPLGGLNNFNPELRRNQYLDDPAWRSELLDVLESNRDSGRLFYNKKLELNQGSYLTQPPIDLLELLNRIYSKANGKPLLELDQFDIKPNHRAGRAATPHHAKSTPLSLGSDTSELTAKDLVSQVYQYARSKGFQFEETDIANFLLSLRTKPFVLLTGISGTGKTQLPKLFAQALGFSKDQLSLVAVRPDWTDSSDLLGYSGLDEEFKPKDLTIAIQRALGNPDKPYFFVLDEMNLARVEHYFSDFLSVIETRARGDNGVVTTDPIIRAESLHNAKNKKDFSGLTWPQNLFLVGTVNMDESTHAFSRKVLDRANAIEMNAGSLDWPVLGPGVLPLTHIGYDQLSAPYLNAADLGKEERRTLTELGVIEFLRSVNSALEIADLHFAYRVRDEVAFYLLLNREHSLMSHDDALDFQLMQKVLPRINGSSERVQRVLLKMLELLTGVRTDHREQDMNELTKAIDQRPSPKFSRSVKKLLFMLRRFDEDRFTSFWV